MPPKRAVEAVKSTEECILQFGKTTNVIKWREHMQVIATELYGIVGMFFTTNMRYELPKHSYRDQPMDSSEESSSSESDEEVIDSELPAEDPITVAAAVCEKVARNAARDVRNERRRKASERSRAKLKEDEYIQRKRDLKAQKEHERTLYPMMWRRMSLASQTRVREEEDFQEAYMTLDCIMLWTMIRRTHLTHMFGDDDALMEINQHRQESKYGSMRQGERELLVTFKSRFDEQVEANRAVGIAEVIQSKRALDFLGKLDPKRYRKMHDSMKNDALRRKPGAFPPTLANAFHIANGWHEDDTLTPTPGAPNAAYVTGGVHSTTPKATDKKAVKTGGAKKKPLTEVECYLCEQNSHYARDCPQRKSSSGKVHVSIGEPTDGVTATTASGAWR